MQKLSLSKFWKENGRMLLLALIAVIAGMFIGVAIGLAMHTDEPSVSADSVGIRSVLPSTDISKRIKFSACGHTIAIPIDTASFIGYTEKELAAFYASSRIVSFEADCVSIESEAEGYCPAHFVLILEDGGLLVKQTDPNTLSQKTVYVISLGDEDRFSHEIYETLLNGVAFDTLEEIDTWLESAES